MSSVPRASIASRTAGTTGPRAARWWRRSGAPGPVLLAALLAVACGDDEPEGRGTLVRLQPRPVPGAPPLPAPVVEQRLDLAADLARWSTNGELVVLPYRDRQDTVRASVPDREAAASARAGQVPPEALLWLRRTGPLEARRFNEVVVHLATGGTGRLAAVLERDGQPVATTPHVDLPTGTAITELVLPLPESVADEGEPFDALVLVFTRPTGLLWVRALELVHRPAGDRLPSPGAEPELIEVAGEARRGWGLIGGAPLVAEVDAPDGARLSFAYALPPMLARRHAAPEVVLAVEGPDGRVTRERFALRGDGAEWHDATVKLPGPAGRVRLRWELEGEGAGACAFAEPRLWTPSRRPPAVLLVTSDTHRADHLGAAPHAEPVATPALDALAARGVLFSDCLATANVTNPSHTALLTGRHPRDVGILGNTQALAGWAGTLAQRFAEAGWATHAVVSAHHLGHPTSGLGLGFDRMAWPVEKNEWSAEAAVARAERWLGDAEERPLFLWVHLFDAHSPYEPPASFAAQYYPRELDPFDPSRPAPDLPDGVLGWELEGLRDAAWPAAAYKGEVSYLDRQLARLLGHARLAEATVAFTADHGESLGEHGIWFSHSGLYPETLHVPLVLAWPEGPERVRVDHPVDHLDLGATLLELAGLQEADFPGRSLLPLVASAAAVPPAGRVASVAAAPGGNPLRPDPARGPVEAPPRFALSSHAFEASLTWNGWHLVLHLKEPIHDRMSSRFERHQVQLYDLLDDPGCMVDLVDVRRDLADALRSRLLAWLAAAEPLGWTGAERTDSSLLQDLAALGYTQPDPSSRNAPLWQPDTCDWCRRFE